MCAKKIMYVQLEMPLTFATCHCDGENRIYLQWAWDLKDHADVPSPLLGLQRLDSKWALRAILNTIHLRNRK